MIWLILFLALLLRLIRLDQSLWLDEATQAILSSGSLYSIYFERAADFHPPLSYLLLHFWMKFGTSEVWLRLFSVLFGVATVAILYLFAKQMIDKKFALLVALFLSIAPYHIYYSQEVRMYAMTTLFATVSMYFFYLIIQRNGVVNSVLYILSSAALLYTHYIGFLLLFSQILFIIWRKKKELLLWRNLFFIIILFLPQLPQFFIQMQSGVNIDQYLPGWRQILSLDPFKALPLIFLKFSIGRIDFYNVIQYLTIAFFVLSFFGSLLIRGVIKLKKEDHLIAFWLFVPIMLSWLISFKIPLNQPFRLLLCLPAFYMLIALGLRQLKWQKILILLVVIISMFGLFIYYTQPKFWREDWRGATNFVNNNLKTSSIVVFAWPQPFPPYNWYQGKQGIGVVKNLPAKEREVADIMDNELVMVNEIFLFEYLHQLSDPNNLINKWLSENDFIFEKTYDFRGVGFIHHFVKL